MLAIALALAVFWLTLAALLAVRRWSAPGLPAASADFPSTTVLLPVRDEEANLADCLAGLLALEGAPRIRVVDDGSTDATPRLLAELAANHLQIEILIARPLPERWSGKVNALATGLEGLESDWVLLTDADTRHVPELLARAHAAAAEHHLDALSLAGRQEARGFGENLITPPVFALLDLLLGDWAPHARGEGRDAIANGQYFLVRRAALVAIGGFGAIVGQPLDDVALARALRAGGFRVGFRRAGSALRVRMYSGFAATIRGWRRNLALVLGGRPAIVSTVLFLGFVTAAVLVGLSLPRYATPVPPLFPLPPLIATWGVGAMASALARASAGNHPLFGLFFPLDLLALAVLLGIARSDHRRGRLASWKGRSIGR